MRYRNIAVFMTATLIFLIAPFAYSAGASQAPASNDAKPSHAAADAPDVIKLGTVYAGSGSYASQSLAEYHGLKIWIQSQNDKGGVYVGAFDKRIPIKLVAYNDQSSPSTAGTFYNRLITQDNVDILVSDFGSVLTAPATTIAKNHGMLLFDVSGTGAAFFEQANPYIVLTSYPTSAIWPKAVWKFIIENNLDKVAILYATNDYTASQAMAVKEHMVEAGLKPVYFKGTATNTSSYAALVTRIKASGAKSVFEFGYPANDMNFLRAMKSTHGNYKYVFTSDSGNAFPLYLKNLGEGILESTLTYGYPPTISFHNPSVGMSTSQFIKMLEEKSPKSLEASPNSAIAGYTAGLIIQAALKRADELSQMGMRKALNKASGEVSTLSGIFKIDPETGAQLGMFLPLAQIQPAGGKQDLQIKVVFPEERAKAEVIEGWPAKNGQ